MRCNSCSEVNNLRVTQKNIKKFEKPIAFFHNKWYNISPHLFCTFKKYTF